MRGFLLERGIAIAQSASRGQRLIPQIIADPGAELTAMTREIVGTLYGSLLQINEKIRYFDKKIAAVFHNDPICQRLSKIRGVGPKQPLLCRCVGRWRGFSEWPSYDCLDGVGVPPTFARRPKGFAQNQQARQPAFAHAFAPWRSRCCKNCCEEVRSGSDAAITELQLPSPTRMHGYCGPCFGTVMSTAPPPDTCHELQDERQNG